MCLIPPGGIIDSWCRPDRVTGLGNNKEEEAPVSSEDNNKALARRFLEAFANADLHTLDELLAPEFINHSLLPRQDPGREGYIQTAAEKHAAFSDIRHIVEYQATDGEEIRARGMPLGLMAGMSYEEGEVSLGEGGCVLFYSDGLVEAHDPRRRYVRLP
jgi:hypothetical protein